LQDFKIISDSTCDLSADQAKDMGVDIVPLYLSINGRDYLKENVELPLKTFYKAIRERVMPKTSQPSVDDYLSAFLPYLENKLDIMCFCLSAKLSGSYQSAVNAANILLERYRERKILVLDTDSVSYGLIYMMMEAKRLSAEGLSSLKVIDLIRRQISRSRAYFTMDSLEYLQRGGRIGGLSSLVGTLLNIKPVGLLKNGDVIPVAKVRSRKRAIEQIVRISLDYMEGRYRDFYIGPIHTDCPEDAQAMRELLVREAGEEAVSPVLQAGATIGAHSGPTTIGVLMFPRIKTQFT